MQYEHDNCKYRSGHDNCQRHPRNPLSRPQKQLAFPRSHTLSGWWMDDDTGIWNNAFHAYEVVLGMFRRPHKKVLDIVVRPAKAKERIRGEQRMIRCLWELTDCLARCQHIRISLIALWPSHLEQLTVDQRCQEQYTCMTLRNSSLRMAVWR